jgi:TPR repeat protein
MYLQGWGITKDDSEAMNWLRKAADRGAPDAQFNLGGMYVMGRGVAKNDAEAVAWFRKAAEQGFAPALEALRRLGVR